MTSKLKGFAKDSLFYGIGDLLGKLVNLILVPILSRIFLPSGYGVIDLLTVSYVFLSMLLNLNLPTGFQKFYYIYKDGDRKLLLTSMVLFLSFFSAIFTFLLIIFSRDISFFVFKRTDYCTAIILCAIRLPIDSLFLNLMILLRLRRKAVSFCVYYIVRMIILPLTTYICVVSFDMGLTGVFLSPLITSAVLALIAFLHQKNEFLLKIDFSVIRSLIKFSLPGHPAIISMSIMSLLPRYLLAYFSPLAVVGLFGMATRIGNVVEMARAAFNRAWNPFAFENAEAADVVFLYEKVFKSFIAALILLSLLLSLFAKEALYILTPPEYHTASSMVPGLCIYYGLGALPIIFSTALYSVNKVVHTSLMEIVQLISFSIAGLIFIPHYNAIGLILALDLSSLICCFFYGIIVKRHFPFRFSTFRILALFTFAVGTYFAFVLTMSNGVFTLTTLICKLMAVIFNMTIAVLIIFTKEEKEQIKSIVLSRINRFGSSNRILLGFFNKIAGS